MTEAGATVAVIICSYDIKRRQLLKDAIDSVLSQTIKPAEIIVVISSSQELFEIISSEYPDVRAVFSEKPLSATQARNRGIAVSNSDILAFGDDDIVADKDWIKNLLAIYSGSDALAVGGKILPSWMSGEPDFLPEELYWLVGAMHESYLPDRVIETRNVYGPNMSFRRTVFDKVGLFEESLGFADRGNSYVQGEEPEFGLRMLDKLGRGTIYNPAALVYHRVPAGKLKLDVLFKRSFYQGYTKAVMSNYSKSPRLLGPEKTYLNGIIGHYIPYRIKGIFTGKAKWAQARKLYVLLVSVSCVGAGFLFGKVRAPHLKPSR
jgi:glucosyl-dolichyl phosphate glucuronosyltransferase